MIKGTYENYFVHRIDYSSTDIWSIQSSQIYSPKENCRGQSTQYSVLDYLCCLLPPPSKSPGTRNHLKANYIIKFQFKPNYIYLNVNVLHLWGFKYKMLHIPMSSSSANATMWIPFKSSSFKKENVFLFVGILNLYLYCKMNPYRSKSKINFEEDFKTSVILLTQVSNMSSALSFLSVGLWRYLIWSLKATVSRVRSICLEILKACFVKYIY